MNRYPAKPMMDEMAKYGRYGDTMLVHMNPVEVAGIASLVPGGRLTTNPVTGQPEAFLPILFGALGGALKLGTLGTAALTGVGTAAVTGDAKRGILAGLTAGASSKLGELFSKALDAPMVAPGGITNVIPDAAKTGVEAAKASTDAVQAAAQSGDGLASVAQDLSQQSVIDPFPDMPASIAPKNMSPANIDLSSVPPPQPQNFSQKIFGGVEDAVSGGLDKLGPMGNLAVAGMGAGNH